jgi:hypothetical protein
VDAKKLNIGGKNIIYEKSKREERGERKRKKE